MYWFLISLNANKPLRKNGEEKNSVNLVIILVLSVHWKRLQIMMMMMPFPKIQERGREREEKAFKSASCPFSDWIIVIHWLLHAIYTAAAAATSATTRNSSLSSFSPLHFISIHFFFFLIDVCLSGKKSWIYEFCVLCCVLLTNKN